MFDFIKKLFKKTSKKHGKKKSCASCNVKMHPTNQGAHNVKKEAVQPTCASVCEAKAAEPEKAEIVVEAKTEPSPEPISVPVDEVTGNQNVTENIAEENTVPEAQYVIKQVKKDIYKFELVSPEGRAVIRSGEYTLKRSCVSGIQSVRKNGSTENTEDRTLENPTKAQNPKYEITVDENSKYRFALKAPNGYVILTSSAYTSKKTCMKVIEAIRAYSHTDKINDMTK